MKLQYDVVVIGAGMVGAALACALKQSGFSVAVVEASSQCIYQPGQDYDLRVSAISPASKHVFEHIGVWQRIEQMRLSPYLEMHVWDANGEGLVHFSCHETAQQQLGYIIENNVIQAALQSRLIADGVDIYWQSKLVEIQSNCHDQTITLDNGDCLVTKLLVGADGANSKVRQLANIFAIESSYYQMGLVAVVETDKSHLNTAWQRFLPTGPLAFLPLENNHCSIVWSTQSQDAERLCQMPDQAFCEVLAKAFDYRLGEIQGLGPRAVFPLRYMHAQTYIKPGVALVGDAAHVVHPLAGQGVNLGLLDVAELVACLENARKKSVSIAGVQALRPYERRRRSQNQIMLTAMDSINKIFTSTSDFWVEARNAGLQCVNRMRPLKQVLMQQAMGLDDDLPNLAKPLSESRYSIDKLRI